MGNREWKHRYTKAEPRLSFAHIHTHTLTYTIQAPIQPVPENVLKKFLKKSFFLKKEL